MTTIFRGCFVSLAHAPGTSLLNRLYTACSMLLLPQVIDTPEGGAEGVTVPIDRVDTAPTPLPTGG